jgi:hypothetical protein
VTLPKDWVYVVDRHLDAKLSNVLDHDQYFLAVGRYLRPIVKTGLVGRMRCLLDVEDLVFDIRTQQAQRRNASSLAETSEFETLFTDQGSFSKMATQV